jgi:predicted RecA/RadA family phage recombinase
MATGSGGDSIQNLRTGKYTHTAAVSAGDILAVGGNVMEAVDDYAANAEGVYIVQGKRIWPKEAALAINFLDQIFWDKANNVITKTQAGNIPCGFCAENALAADTTVTFMLIPNLSLDTPATAKTRAVVALADAAATLTATQMVDSSIFTITPTAGRNLTTATAAQLVAAVPGARVGGWFDFTVISLAAFAATLVGGTGVTIVGNAAANNASATFRVRFDNVGSGTEAVTIYRI